MNHFEKFNQWILDHQNKGKLHIDHARGQFEMSVVSQEGVPVGVNVSNLGEQSFLPMSVFYATLLLLKEQGGKALRGEARKYKLGEGDLPLNSIDGYIASTIYKKEKGISVTARITPISRILEKAEVCESNRDGYLYLA